MFEVLIEFLIGAFAGVAFVPERGSSFFLWWCAVLSLLGFCASLVMVLLFSFGGLTWLLVAGSLLAFLVTGNLNRAYNE